MSTAVATAPHPRAEEVSRPRQPRATTLEAAIAGAWEDLLGRGRAECLVCGGELRAADAAAGGPAAAGPAVGGACERCGATLD